MTVHAATFFGWLQDAPFYAEAHREAVALVPRRPGQPWLDVGCGAGLVAAFAAERGFDARGIDSDEAMVREARRRWPRIRFDVEALEAPAPQVDVVSAASLLYPLPNRALAFATLWSKVRPGGHLLVVETTRAMRPATALRVAARQRPGRRAALLLWAAARRGRCVDDEVLSSVPVEHVQRTELLGGLLAAWVLRKAVE